MSHVVKVRKELVPGIKDSLLKSHQVQELPPTNPYETFRLKFGDEIIVAYSSGKIVATGDMSEKILSSAVTGMHRQDHGQIIIGSDEAGKGEWLGPLVVAAVALSPDKSDLLIAKGVMDSKLLKLDDVRKLAEVVKDAALAFKLVIVSPIRFNELMMDVKDEGKSLNDVLAWAHSLAIKNVTDRIPRNGRKIRIVIDEFDKLKTENRLRRVINQKDFEVSQYPKAEEETAVAAASILARDAREQWIDDRSRTAVFDLRTMNSIEAIRNPEFFSFAKISFLKLGKSESEVLISTLFQQTATIDHQMRKLAESFSVQQAGRSLHEIMTELGERKLVTEYLIDEIRKITEVRNLLVHGSKLGKGELVGASELCQHVIQQLRTFILHVEKEKRR